MNATHITGLIKSKALALGFSACGITSCAPIEAKVTQAYTLYLQQGRGADMQYLERYMDQKFYPQKLVPEAHSIIMVLAPYYSSTNYETLKQSQYSIARYAWGEDYHHVVKHKLKQLQLYISELAPKSTNRYFADTAPVMEKYLAQRAGLGWIGHNTLLVNEHGSYHFIGSLFTSLALEYDTPNHTTEGCTNCNLCQQACPHGALGPQGMDARKCMAYQSIENHGDIQLKQGSLYIYGCDECQKACPYNARAVNSTINEFHIHPALLQYTNEQWENITMDEFNTLFATSAVKRIGWQKLKNNIQYAHTSAYKKE